MHSTATPAPAPIVSTPPTSAPSRPEPTIAPNTTPASAEGVRAAATAAAAVEQNGDRDEQENRKRRLELVAEPVVARTEARVRAQERAHDEVRAVDQIGAVGQHGGRAGDEDRARPADEPVGDQREGEARHGDDDQLVGARGRQRRGEQQHRQHPAPRQRADAHRPAHAAPVAEDPADEQDRQPGREHRLERREAPRRRRRAGAPRTPRARTRRACPSAR